MSDGPGLSPGEKVEVAEVSALRAEWEEELLSEGVKKRVAKELEATCFPKDHNLTQPVIENAARQLLDVALAAVKEEKGGRS